MKFGKHKLEGRKIIDATKPLTVYVRKSDIERSDPKEPGSCAMANAICRQLHVAEARVHLSRTYILDKKKDVWVRYHTPLRLREQIVSFDRGYQFDADDYRLVPPSHAIGTQQGSKTGQNKNSHLRDRKKPSGRRHYIKSVRRRAP